MLCDLREVVVRWLLDVTLAKVIKQTLKSVWTSLYIRYISLKLFKIMS